MKEIIIFLFVIFDICYKKFIYICIFLFLILVFLFFPDTFLIFLISFYIHEKNYLAANNNNF